jgi:hypothetical protein
LRIPRKRYHARRLSHKHRLVPVNQQAGCLVLHGNCRNPCSIPPNTGVRGFARELSPVHSTDYSSPEPVDFIPGQLDLHVIRMENDFVNISLVSVKLRDFMESAQCIIIGMFAAEMGDHKTA